MKPTAVISSCPVCGSDAFAATPDCFDLGEVLRRWERETQFSFREVVWKEYTFPVPKRVTLYRCAQCHLAMFQPPLAGSREFYADVTARECYVADKWEFVRAIKALKRYRCRRVLDIGCGSGDFLDLLRDSSLPIDSAGYDFSPEAAALARAKGHTVYNGSFPESILLANSGQLFDAICMFQVLEHVSDPVAYLQDVRRLLTPFGILIIGVPDADGPVRHFSSALTDIPPHHVSRWCETTFRVAMPRQGFHVVSVAREPLPHYLWCSYLPVMFERDFLPGKVGRAMNRSGITKLLIGLLTRFGMKWLPGVSGHTLYVELRPENSGQE
jgi:SAM-dependent methyltransferase